MTRYLMIENKVKRTLNIESFCNISKYSIMGFISLISNMNKDISLRMIIQFPLYVNMDK